MLSYITKDQYFGWIEQYGPLRAAYSSASVNNLKDIQDHYAISRLAGSKGLRVLEVGGGDCRVLRGFAQQHECWNAEKFMGKAIGPKSEVKFPGVRNALVYLGEFSPELPDGYFDIVYSISVVEHIENDELPGFFKDIARVLKPGGLTFHAIDIYVFDESQMKDPVSRYFRDRLDRYWRIPEVTDGALSFAQDPSPAARTPVFSCAYASNSDREMLAWNRYAPKLKAIRSVSQSVSLMAEWVKGAPSVRTPVLDRPA
jgi:SAM-dependent methyltransferase